MVLIAVTINKACRCELNIIRYLLATDNLAISFYLLGDTDPKMLEPYLSLVSWRDFVWS